MVMPNMNDKVALITGANSGIGRATAEAFAAKGAKVVVAARRVDELATLVADIESRGGEAIYVCTGVSVEDDVERLVLQTIRTFGRLDFAVNNAGFEGKVVPITKCSEEVWDRVLGINLKRTFLCMRHEAKAMLEAGDAGAIVNAGSINSFLGFPGFFAVRRLEAWHDRSDHERICRACPKGNQGEHCVSGNNRHADAPSRKGAVRRRGVRSGAAT
jgi:NAD(P)-dependent dehydrogenase (short-subunit alcohol dehydrogenase family)